MGGLLEDAECARDHTVVGGDVVHNNAVIVFLTTKLNFIKPGLGGQAERSGNLQEVTTMVDAEN